MNMEVKIYDRDGKMLTDQSKKEGNGISGYYEFKVKEGSNEISFIKGKKTT